MTRTDIHRPSAINPTEYQFVAFDYFKLGSSGDILADCAALQQERAVKQAHMARTGGKYSNHEHGGNCMICGNANAIYTVTFYHALTNVYVSVGQDCAEKLDASGYSESTFNSFRSTISNALEAQAGKRKAVATLDAANLSKCWPIYDLATRPMFQDRGYEENTIINIVEKLVKYGSLSPKQVKFLGDLLTQIDTRAARDAARKLELENAADCPAGRIEIAGTVLAVKVQDGYYGPSTKVLVKHDSGWKVWGTRVGNFNRGDKVKFTATVTVSDKDSKFGFFKRPTNPVVLEMGVTA
jgi:hypothetical protein